MDLEGSVLEAQTLGFIAHFAQDPTALAVALVFERENIVESKATVLSSGARAREAMIVDKSWVLSSAFTGTTVTEGESYGRMVWNRAGTAIAFNRFSGDVAVEDVMVSTVASS